MWLPYAEFDKTARRPSKQGRKETCGREERGRDAKLGELTANVI